MVAGWVPGATDIPLPPQNAEVLSPYIQGVLDIRWDNPALLAHNSVYTVVGVNIWRSDVSDRGPFFRINEFPIGGTFYRDQTSVGSFSTTDVINWETDWLARGECSANTRRFRFRTQHPILKPQQFAPFDQPTYANSPFDVTVKIDGVEVIPSEVFGRTGEITLINQSTYNPGTDLNDEAILPDENSVVEVTYKAATNHIRSGLDAKIWYRLTTVVLDDEAIGGMKETPLDHVQPHSVIEVERLDYIWRRAIRMNHWILQQGGERVKVFIRRQSGIPCPCDLDERSLEFSKQPSIRCEVCYGTGFCGGYEGPFDVLMAPDDAERRISQRATGRRLEHAYEVWMGPSPVVTQRDFVVKQTNERYSIGAVRRPSNRGNLLQQHFTIAYLDQGDVRYKVPIDGVIDYTYPETRYAYVHAPSLPVDGSAPNTVHPWTGDPPFEQGPRNVTPMITEKDNTPDEKEQRGRTAVWENINY
jgi:hypothetical protein